MPLQDNPNPDETRLPDELADRLSTIHDPQLFVPPDIDQAILAKARVKFGVTDRQTGRPWLRLAAPLAAAASIVLGVWIVWPSTTTPLISPPIAIVGDIDQNGSVDILDAFALARHIDAGQPTSANWDITADGQVDRADVLAITTIAVSLSGKSRDANPGAGGGGASS
jgi:Dockerin type I domain